MSYRTETISDDKQIRFSAVAFATLLHAGVVALLLAQSKAGGLPNGRTGVAHDRIISIALVPLDGPAPAARLRADTAPSRSPAGSAAKLEGGRLVVPEEQPATHDPPGRQSPGTVSLEPNEALAMSDSAVLLYRLSLQAHLLRYRQYPLDARRDHVEGTVYLHFIIEEDGRVVDAWIAQSSGSASLDDEALDAINRAQPLPPIPAGWPRRLDVTLPIAFTLG